MPYPASNAGEVTADDISGQQARGRNMECLRGKFSGPKSAQTRGGEFGTNNFWLNSGIKRGSHNPHVANSSKYSNLEAGDRRAHPAFVKRDFLGFSVISAPTKDKDIIRRFKGSIILSQFPLSNKRWASCPCICVALRWFMRTTLSSLHDQFFLVLK